MGVKIMKQPIDKDTKEGGAWKLNRKPQTITLITTRSRKPVEFLGPRRPLGFTLGDVALGEIESNLFIGAGFSATCNHLSVLFVCAIAI
jgi:hypothetical protein